MNVHGTETGRFSGADRHESNVPKPTGSFVCAECGHHQDSMHRSCDDCGSFRVVSVKTVVAVFGIDYMKSFPPKD